MFLVVVNKPEVFGCSHPVTKPWRTNYGFSATSIGPDFKLTHHRRTTLRSMPPASAQPLAVDSS